MPGLPLVVLGLQPAGFMTVIKAQSYVNECRSRKQHEIICCTCEITGDFADITAAAHDRALATLELYKEAVVGIGLHSNTARLVHRARSRITPVRMVAAALVARNDVAHPIILANSDTTDRAVVSMVAQLVSKWQKRPESGVGNGPILNRLKHAFRR